MPGVLFGAFDRHNAGDLLFPHVAQALLPGVSTVPAGLAARDLRDVGGHKVEAIAALGRRAPVPPELQAQAMPHPDTPPRASALMPTVWHVGGETLTCTAWQAAAMLLPPHEAPTTIAYLAPRDAERRDWARAQLQTDALAPYAAGASFFGGCAPAAYLAVGGVALDTAEPALQQEVLGHLAQARSVTVRDRITLGHLQAAGIHAKLLPDPAVMARHCLQPHVLQATSVGEAAAVCTAFPQGYVAVQCSAEFGDDITLDALAAPLSRLAHDRNWGLVLLRMGAAPWHDDLATLHRLAHRLPRGHVHVAQSLHLWTLCALIAGSRGFVGSSLHGRILAAAWGRARLTVLPRSSTGSQARAQLGGGGEGGKHGAFVRTWEGPGSTHLAVVDDDLGRALQQAFAAPAAELEATARRLVASFKDGWREVQQEVQRETAAR